MVKGSTHATKTRERIQTSMLINRLEDHMLGKVELSTTQVRSAEILLKKSLPDLQSIEQHNTGEIETKIVVKLGA